MIRLQSSKVISKPTILGHSAVGVLTLLLSVCASAQVKPSVVAVKNVSVVRLESGSVERSQTVLVRGDRIATVGGRNEVIVPADAMVIDGTGRFLIPGLWDMHVHLSAATEASLPLLIAAGVTGVRDMGSDLAELKRWRREIDSGHLIGPRIIMAGPKLDGDGGSIE